MRTADSDIKEELIIALLMETEKGPDGKVTEELSEGEKTPLACKVARRGDGKENS
jgi:hypothetical protein